MFVVPRVVTVFLCTVLQLCFGTVYAWSFFQTMLVRQLGWSNTDTAIAFSVTIFSLGIAAAWAGMALPRLGPRKLALAGSALFSIGYLVAALALKQNSLLLFYLGYGVIGGAGIGFGYVTPVATAAKWFPDKKGLATGIVVMGFGVGAFLFSRLLAPFLVVQTEEDLPLIFMWLGLVFAVVLIPISLLISDPPKNFKPPGSADSPASEPAAEPEGTDRPDFVLRCLMSREFIIIWLIFFFNISAGISVISFQSSLLQDVWGLAEPTLEPLILAEYGAMLIAVSSLFNGLGRLFWGLLSDHIGRVTVFRILLASQMVVFAILMTENDPWIFSVLICYILLCFGGGFATMPSYIVDVFGSRHMSAVYGAVLTAWAAAGIVGPLYVGYYKDVYPDRAVIYCFLIGMLILGIGLIFSFLLDSERIRLEKPTLKSTLDQFGITAQRTA